MELKKVFVVDDDVFFLGLMEQHLKNAGIKEVVTFEDGGKFLDRIQEKPELIILDFLMETLDGLEILRKIRRQDPNVFVVVVSAQNKIRPAVEMLKLGAFDYIRKEDITPETIPAILERIEVIQEAIQKENSGFLKNIRRLFAA